MSRPGAGGHRKPVSYKEKYEEVSNQFWRLQQIEETEEEAAYAKLCTDLESMLVQFREELADLETQNQNLQRELEGMSNIKAKYQQLKEEEAYLLQLKSDLDNVSRT